MNEKQKNNTLGCFGAVTCYSVDSNICNQCPSFKDCGEETYKTLQSIKGIINVEGLIRQHEMAKLKMSKKIDEQRNSFLESRKQKARRAAFESLPEKAKLLVESIRENNLAERIIEDAKVGKNALEKCGPKWLSVAVSMLIGGGFTLVSLSARFQKDLGMSGKNSFAYAALSEKVLFVLNLTEEREQVVNLK